MTDQGRASGVQRHLVLHDYGMGGLWWWVWARSAAEITATCAEVEVVDDPDAIRRAEGWSLDEVNLDAPDPQPLSSFRAKRAAQRGLPGFGALAGRGRVYVRWQEEGADEVWLMELGADGRWIRQVELRPDGDAVAMLAEDWPINPPYDLHDPDLAPREMSAADFEEAWGRARPDDGSTA